MQILKAKKRKKFKKCAYWYFIYKINVYSMLFKIKVFINTLTITVLSSNAHFNTNYFLLIIKNNDILMIENYYWEAPELSEIKIIRCCPRDI